MEDSAYGDYEDSRAGKKELFQKSGLIKEDRQIMLEFKSGRDEAKAAYQVFVEHPAVRELLQQKNLDRNDKMWTQVLPVINLYLRNLEHVESHWKARDQFKSRLKSYFSNTSGEY